MSLSSVRDKTPSRSTSNTLKQTERKGNDFTVRTIPQLFFSLLLAAPKPAEPWAADLVLTVVPGGMHVWRWGNGAAAFHQLQSTFLQSLCWAGWWHLAGNICASRNFQGITAWELQQCAFGEVGNKKCFKTQEPCREPAGSWAVKSHNMLFATDNQTGHLFFILDNE